MVTYSLQYQFIQRSINTSSLDLKQYVNVKLALSTLRCITIYNFLYFLVGILSKIFSSKEPTVKIKFHFLQELKNCGIRPQFSSVPIKILEINLTINRNFWRLISRLSRARSILRQYRSTGKSSKLGWKMHYWSSSSYWRISSRVRTWPQEPKFMLWRRTFWEDIPSVY